MKDLKVLYEERQRADTDERVRLASQLEQLNKHIQIQEATNG